jgi:hypothetical protein
VGCRVDGGAGWAEVLEQTGRTLVLSIDPAEEARSLALEW